MKKNKNIHILIAVIIYFVMNFILGRCTDMGITAAGASTLSLFIATIYTWITYGTGWVSMLSIGLLAFTGIAPAATIMANSFGNSTTVICIGTMVLCVALEENGVTKIIADWFITRNVVKNRPYMFIFMFLLANLVICYFMEATAVMIIFVALAHNILEELGYTKDDKFSKAIYLGVLWITCIGNGATPIGHPVPLLMLNSGAKITGVNPSWLKYMAIGIPLSLVTLLITILIFKFILKPDCSKYSAYDVDARRANMDKLSTEGKISLIVYVALIVVWLAPDTIGKLIPAVGTVLSAVGSSIPSLIATAIVCAITVKGKPVLKYETAVKSVSWSTIIFIACIFLYASAFNMESGGIKVFLQTLVAPITTSLSPWLLAAVFIFFVIFVTNFASNGVTGTIGILVGVPAMLAVFPLGSVVGYTVMVAILCNMGIATPGGSGFVAIAQKDEVIGGGETLKYSLLLIVLMYVASLFVFWPIAQAIF